MKRLLEKNRERVLDLLLARLSFERAAVKLYDAILAKMRESHSKDLMRMHAEMTKHRGEEKEHEEWLEAQIRAAGGDAHGESAMSRVAESETSGVERVVLEPTSSLPAMFDALLLAELGDNAGWELLVRLAAEAHDRDAKQAFKRRLHEEEDHLVFARRVIQRLARRDILGQRVSMPTGIYF